MAAIQEPNLSLNHSWASGENNWDAGMNANLKRIGALIYLSVKNLTTNALPSSPTEGDRYIIPASGATWGTAKYVAVYANGAWTFYQPKRGWRAYNESDENFYHYDGASWEPESTELSISEISGLQAALDAKSDTGHSHSIANVTGLQSALDGKAAASHTHTQSEVTGLTSALAGKSDTGHGHAIADVTGLQTALDGKSATGHGHAIADVTGLQTALDGKSATGHSHAISDVTGLQTALDSKAASSHSHAINDVTGLQSALDSKAASSHGHAISDVTGLQSALDSANVLDISTWTDGKPTASQVVLRFVAAAAYTLPASLTGSRVKAGTAATGSSTFDIQKNGVSIGSFNIAASGTTATFTFSSSVSFAAGDVLTIVAPGSQDATLADVAITLRSS